MDKKQFKLADMFHYKTKIKNNLELKALDYFFTIYYQTFSQILMLTFQLFYSQQIVQPVL